MPPACVSPPFPPPFPPSLSCPPSSRCPPPPSRALGPLRRPFRGRLFPPPPPPLPIRSPPSDVPGSPPVLTSPFRQRPSRPPGFRASPPKSSRLSTSSLPPPPPPNPLPFWLKPLPAVTGGAGEVIMCDTTLETSIRAKVTCFINFGCMEFLEFLFPCAGSGKVARGKAGRLTGPRGIPVRGATGKG